MTSDRARRNARENSDRHNARIERDKALARVMSAVPKGLEAKAGILKYS